MQLQHTLECCRLQLFPVRAVEHLRRTAGEIMKFPGSSSQMFQMGARNKEINGEPLRKAPGEEREGGLLTSCRVVVVRPLCQRFLRRGSHSRFARYLLTEVQTRDRVTRSRAPRGRRRTGTAGRRSARRAMHRQDDGVADDVAYHHVAHHFAGHDDMWQHKMEAAVSRARRCSEVDSL